MPVRLTLDLFSGRRNPAFELPDETVAKHGHLSAMRGLLAETPLRLQVPSQPLLGFRGLILEDAGLPTAERGAVLEHVPTGASAGRNVKPLVDSLLELIPRTAESEKVLKALRAFRKAPADGTKPASGSKKSHKPLKRFDEFLAEQKAREHGHAVACQCAPLYEPGWWNDGGPRQFNNNCYNYSTNYRTDTFAQPGLAAGAMYTALDCSSVHAAALADDLQDTALENECPKEGHLVALVIAPGYDYHWYRKGRDDLWTHKPGGTQVTNLDNRGKIITDPRTADRGPYTAFCHFMVVMHGHIKIA